MSTLWQRDFVQCVCVCRFITLCFIHCYSLSSALEQERAESEARVKEAVATVAAEQKVTKLLQESYITH